MSKATELALGDDGGTGTAALSQAQLAEQLGISDQGPPWWSEQLSRGASLVFNGGLVALVRAWVNPPTIEVPSEGGAVPEWYAKEWAERTRWRRLGNQVARDTAALAGAMLLMDVVEAGIKGIRGGKEDPWNRVMGGVTGGGLLGLLWYPANPRSRAFMTAAGSFVGYFSFVADRAVDSSLLHTQRQLEQDLLHKSEGQVRQELSRPYLQTLLRAKQRQMHEAARRAATEGVREEQHALTRPPPPGSAAAAAAAAAAESGRGGVGDFGDGASYGGGGGESGSTLSTPSQPGRGDDLSSSSRGSSRDSGSSGYSSYSGRSSSSRSSSDTSKDRGVLVIREEEEDGDASGADGVGSASGSGDDWKG